MPAIPFNELDMPKVTDAYKDLMDKVEWTSREETRELAVHLAVLIALEDRGDGTIATIHNEDTWRDFLNDAEASATKILFKIDGENS
jgi:hypothetical protein